MMGGNPNDPNSLTNRFNQGTATTFQMLEGIVGAFGGFAQMLESTYMATHSSFYAMVSVAEQFSNLRETLGSLLGIFTVLRWVRTAAAKLTGRPLPADSKALTPASFAQYEGRPPPPGTPPRASRKPLLFFLLAAFGLPYVMSKVIRTLTAAQEEEQRRRLAETPHAGSLNPATLEFCRVIYDFAPETAHQGQDLAVRKGDLVAVLSKADPFGNPIDWWHCRTRDGRVGYLPSSFLETIKRNPPAQKPIAAIKDAAASESSRANSLTSTVEVESVSVPDKEPMQMPIPVVKVNSVIDNFQKSQFYS
jgi:peroxin-13